MLISIHWGCSSPKLDVVVVFLRLSLPAEVFLIRPEVVFFMQRVQQPFGENVLWMDGFTLDHPTKYSNKNTKTHGIDQDKGLAVSHLEILLSLEVQTDFLIDKVLVGCLFNIFEFSYLYNAKRKICMHVIYIYIIYATTVNLPVGVYTP